MVPSQPFICLRSRAVPKGCRWQSFINATCCRKSCPFGPIGELVCPGCVASGTVHMPASHSRSAFMPACRQLGRAFSSVAHICQGCFGVVGGCISGCIWGGCAKAYTSLEQAAFAFPSASASLSIWPSFFHTPHIV